MKEKNKRNFFAYAYFVLRLEDLGLLTGAWRWEYGDKAFVAVPVGGRRRGGYISAAGRKDARCIIRLLHGRAGFPSLRLSFCRIHGTLVRWGDSAPVQPNKGASERDRLRWIIKSGRYYGYSDKAILDLLLRYKGGPV